LSEEGCINSHAGLQAEKHKKQKILFDGNRRFMRSRNRTIHNKRARGEEMTHLTDMKMALLAALILLTAVVCARDEDKVVEAEPALMQAPFIETQILAG